MVRRGVCVLVIAILPILGGGAAAAKAEPLFEAGSYPATIDATALQKTVFGFATFYAWECKALSVEGSLASKASALTLTPGYSECRWQYPPGFPFSQVQISMNGCDYRLHGLKRVAATEYTATLDIECPTGKQIVVELHEGTPTICTLTLPTQSNLSDIKLTDIAAKEGTPEDLEASFTVEGIHYSQTNESTSCPVEVGTYQDMTLKGIDTLRATGEGGKLTGLKVSGE